jgi:hypothetical protein
LEGIFPHADAKDEHLNGNLMRLKMEAIQLRRMLTLAVVGIFAVASGRAQTTSVQTTPL